MVNVGIILVVSFVAFTIIYALLPDESFEVNNVGGKLTMTESAFMSINTQTLLGISGVTPISRASRAFVSIQSIITLAIIVSLIK